MSKKWNNANRNIVRDPLEDLMRQVSSMEIDCNVDTYARTVYDPETGETHSLDEYYDNYDEEEEVVEEEPEENYYDQPRTIIMHSEDDDEDEEFEYDDLDEEEEEPQLRVSVRPEPPKARSIEVPKRVEQIASGEDESPLASDIKSALYGLSTTYNPVLGRLIINDNVSPSSLEVDTVVHYAANVVDEDSIMRMCMDKDGQYSEDAVNGCISDLVNFIIIRKHPIALYDERSFVEAFKDIQDIDASKFRVVSIIDPDGYFDFYAGYYIPDFMGGISTFVEEAASKLVSTTTFLDDMKEDIDNPAVKNMLMGLSTLAIIFVIAQRCSTNFDSFLVENGRYLRNYAKIVASNMAFESLVRADDETVAKAGPFNIEDLNRLLNVIGTTELNINGINIMETMKGNWLDDEEEDGGDTNAGDDDTEEEEAEYSPFPQTSEPEEDDELNENLWEQVGEYESSDIDFAQVQAGMVENNARVERANAVYDKYVDTVKEENPDEPVVSREEFMEGYTEVTVPAPVVEAEKEVEKEPEVQTFSGTPYMVKPEPPKPFVMNTAEVKVDPIPTAVNNDMYSKLAAVGLKPTEEPKADSGFLPVYRRKPPVD